MAEDIFTAPQAPEQDAAVEGAAGDEQNAETDVQQDPQIDTAPVDDPADAPQPTFNVSVAEDSGLEAPVFVTVPGLYSNVEPVPHPDDIKDSEGNYLPGYDESTATLVQTHDGWERPDSADQAEARVNLDEHGRLELSAEPVAVPAVVARSLEGLPYVRITEVRN